MKILCIDSNSIVNRAYYGVKPLTTKDGVYTNAVFGFMNILLKLLADYEPDAVAFAFDLKAPTFRHKMYDGYKAQRKGMPDELAQQLPFLKELLAHLGYKTVELEGYEADDILGTFSKKADDNTHVYIATGDRDSLQLVNDNVTVLLASTKMGQTQTVVCTPEYIMEKYGIQPHELIQVKALMGDTSDNIPGVAGIGEKTALKLIGEYKNLDNIYDQIDSIDVTKSVREKLKNGKDSAYLSLKLAEIFCEVPFDSSPDNYRKQDGDTDAAYRLLSRLEMSSIIKKLGLSPSSNASAESCAATAPTVPALCFCGCDFSKINSSSPVLILPKWENGSIIKLGAVCSNEIFIFTEEQQIKTMLESDIQKVTVDCKQLWHYCIENNISLGNICFDITLAAYLLSPSSSDYSLEILAGEHSAEYSLPNEFPQDDAETVENLCRMYALYSVMHKKLEDYGQLELLEKMEIPLARVLSYMEIDGFRVDKDGILSYGEEISEGIARLEQSIYAHSGENFNINSPQQLGKILFEKLELPVRKKTKTGYSTNAEVLESLIDAHPIVRDILEYRKLAKLRSTYVEGLVKQISADGKIHTHFNQTDTRTGRLSSTEPNLQNIPVRTELGSQLRKFFTADDGCVLIDADYSQIELRVLAHISGDENMTAAFQSGEDIHTNTAAQVFDLPPLFVTPEMRRRAKAVNFGIVYGIGAYSLSQDIGVSVKEADRYIKNYLATFSGVAQYMEKTISNAKQYGYVSTLFGRRRYLPEINSSNKIMQAFGQRVAMNAPIQGTAADIIKIAMIKVFERLEREKTNARLILQVHDELLVQAPENEAEQVRKMVLEEMEAAAQLAVTLSVDAGVGKTWYEAKQ
ncbi:MAG: DNA polymerase I [Oscillospiraceae bacterium]|nr:DNA polymerase I [Oscillospiraceae bacterium]